MCAFYCIFDDYYRPIRNGDDDDEIVSRDMVTMNWGADWSRETKIVVTMKNELKKKKKKNGKKKKDEIWWNENWIQRVWLLDS